MLKHTDKDIFWSDILLVLIWLCGFVSFISHLFMGYNVLFQIFLLLCVSYLIRLSWKGA